MIIKTASLYPGLLKGLPPFGRLDQAAQDFVTETTEDHEQKAATQTLARVDIGLVGLVY